MRAKYVCVEHASARGVADRWRAQYERNGKWLNGPAGDGAKIYDKLCALGNAPDIATVAEIVGNKSWSYLSCDGCGERVAKAVRIGDSNYGDEPKAYCAICIKEAASILAEIE